MKTILTVATALLLAGCVQPYQFESTRAWTLEDARQLTDQEVCDTTTDGLGTAAEIEVAEERKLKCYKEHKEAIKKITKAEQDKEKAAIAHLTKKPKIITIEDKVLADAIDQYNIVRANGGSDIEKCVYAGMVKAAAAQAKNAAFYRDWNDTERLLCAIAEWAY